MKISQFMTQVAPGMAPTNRFTVLMTPPPTAMVGIGGGNTNLQKVLLFCDTAQLPGLNLNTAPIRTFGEVREMPYEFNFEPITMTFYVDADLYVKKMFDNWIQRTQLGDSRKFDYYDNYVTEMKIFVQDKMDNNRYVVSLFEAYPKTVSAVNMDYAAKDIMKVTVTFQYKYWRSDKYATKTVNKNITSNGGFGLANLQSFFDYGMDTITGGYYSKFTSFQENINQQYFGVVPERQNIYTGTVYADP